MTTPVTHRISLRHWIQIEWLQGYTTDLTEAVWNVVGESRLPAIYVTLCEIIQVFVEAIA